MRFKKHKDWIKTLVSIHETRFGKDIYQTW